MRTFLWFIGGLVVLVFAGWFYTRLKHRQSKRAEHVGASTPFRTLPGHPGEIVVNNPYTGAVEIVDLPDGIKADKVQAVGIGAGGSYNVKILHTPTDRTGVANPDGDLSI